MDTDLFLTVGVFLVIVSLPSLLGAWVEGRAPRVGAIMILAGVGMMAAALVNKPGGYPINHIPQVMLTVVSRALN